MTDSNDHKIASSIVQKLGKDGFEYLKKHGELPAVKLTFEEMEFLKAAGSPSRFWQKLWDSLNPFKN